MVGFAQSFSCPTKLQCLGCVVLCCGCVVLLLWLCCCCGCVVLLLWLCCVVVVVVVVELCCCCGCVVLCCGCVVLCWGWSCVNIKVSFVARVEVLQLVTI